MKKGYKQLLTEANKVAFPHPKITRLICKKCAGKAYTKPWVGTINKSNPILLKEINHD